MRKLWIAASILAQVFAIAVAMASDSEKPDQIHGHAFFTRDSSIVYFVDIYQRSVCTSPYLGENLLRPYGLEPTLMPYDAVKDGFERLASGACDVLAVPYKEIAADIPTDLHALRAKGSSRQSPTVQITLDVLTKGDSRKCEIGTYDLFECGCIGEAFLRDVDGGRLTVTGRTDEFINNFVLGKIDGVHMPYHSQCFKTGHGIREVAEECVGRSRIWPSVPADQTESYCTCLAEHVLDGYAQAVSQMGTKAFSGHATPLQDLMDDKKLCRS